MSSIYYIRFRIVASEFSSYTTKGYLYRNNTHIRFDPEADTMAKQFYPNRKGFSPFRELVGATFTKVENGYSQCVLEIDAKHLNPYGTAHAGVAFTLADSGMGIALWSCIDEDEGCATIENQIVYFLPVKSGTLTCETKLIHRSKRIATLESEIINDGQVVAKAIGTWSIFKAKRIRAQQAE
jgi:acyl-CoA thioesterase